MKFMDRPTIAVKDRGPGVYITPPTAHARQYFDGYIRKVDPKTQAQVDHLIEFGTPLVGVEDARAMVERFKEQGSLYDF